MYKQLFVGGNMNGYSNINTLVGNDAGRGAGSAAGSAVNNPVNTAANAANIFNHRNTLHCEHYATMDLCNQAQMFEDTANILSRMDKLRAFATEQRAKRVTAQRQQTSFCF